MGNEATLSLPPGGGDKARGKRYAGRGRATGREGRIECRDAERERGGEWGEGDVGGRG